MYVVIAGINSLGKKLVDKMEKDHDLVVIDADEDKCERLYSSTTATVINKNPTSIQALEDAGIGDADVLISVLNSDNENMVVCSLGKKYGVPKVVSRVENDQYREAFQVIGAETVSNIDLLLSEFLSTVEHPYLLKVADLPGSREILKAKIKEDSALEGKLASEIKDRKKFPNRFKIAAVIQETQSLTGELNVELKEGNSLILIGPENQKEKLNRFFQNQ